MALSSALASAGIFKPDQISFLRDVFDKMALDGDTMIDRDTRAATLVRLYQSGMRAEDDLLSALGYDDIVGRTAAQLRRSGT